MDLIIWHPFLLPIRTSGISFGNGLNDFGIRSSCQKKAKNVKCKPKEVKEKPKPAAQKKG